MHSATVLAACRRWLRDRDLADEAMGRVALASFSSFTRMDGALENSRAWLLAIARNACMDLFRERRRQHFCPLDEIDPSVATVTTTPALAAETGEVQRVVASAIRMLPSRLRIAAELHIVDGRDYAEVGAALGLTPTNVRKRIQDARRAIRDALDDYSAGLLRCEQVPADVRTDVTASAAGAVRMVHLTAHLPSGAWKDAVVLVGGEAGSGSGVRAIERYLARYPSGWKKRLELARALLRESRAEEALVEYERVTDRHPASLAAWLERASVLEITGRGSEARAVYEAAARAARGPAADALRLLRDGRRIGVEELQRRADALTTEVAHDYAPAMARLFLERGDAASALRFARMRANGDVTSLIIVYDALRELGRDRGAREAAEQAVALDPDNVLAARKLVVARCEAALVDGLEGSVTDALLAKLRARSAGEAATAHVIALAHLARGSVDQAVEELRRFTAARAGHVDGWLAFADVLRRSGNCVAAAMAAWRAHDLDPSDRAAAVALCRALPAVGRSVEAIRMAAELAARFANEPDAVVCVAEITRRVAARTPFARSFASARRGSRLPRVRLAIGELLGAMGDLPAAAAELDEAWADLPLDDAHRLACEIALARAGLDGAEAWYVRALDRARLLQTEAPIAAHIFAGLASEALGDTETARTELAAALERPVPWPLHTRALAALRRLG